MNIRGSLKAPKKGRIREVLIKIGLSLFLSVICNFMLESSLGQVASSVFTGQELHKYPLSFAAGIALLAFFISFVFFLCKSITLPLIIISSAVSVISLVNYYTYKLHGTVLTYEDVKNIGVAAAVISGYRFELSRDVFIVLIYLVALILIGRLLKKVKLKRQPFLSLICLILGAAFFIYAYVFEGLVEHAEYLNWPGYYYEHGFVTGSAEFTMINFSDSFMCPEGYREDEIRGYGGTGVSFAEEDYPDIIFILNETWYDLNHLYPVPADADYMENYNALNAIKGFSLVPMIGGGTNNSEFEYLTSSSSSLLTTTSPFNNINMTGIHSIVDYLESIGYETMAAHPERPGNYNRSDSWERMGFDHAYFSDDFTDLEEYGSRPYATDSSVFDNFIRFYEGMDDNPRFGFLITLQNHGDYDFLPPELIRVHASADGLWQEVEEHQIDEFLTCIDLTDEFIPKITDYFTKLYEEEGRRVIVVMAGDHSPHFVGDIFNSFEAAQTPFFIWSNYEDLSRNAGAVDLTMLAPMALAAGDIPLSPFYSHLYDMSLNNILLIYPYYIDSESNAHLIKDGSDFARDARDYYFMVYNNLKNKDRIESLFEAP